LVSGRAYLLLLFSNPLVYGSFMTQWTAFYFLDALILSEMQKLGFTPEQQ
jgi:hypothetical protein